MRPGEYKSLKMTEYLSVKAFSAGLGQRILAQSPLHAWTESPWNPNQDLDDSGTADIGTYAHAMLLEGGHAALCVVEADDWRTKAAKEARDSARLAGLLPILAGKVSEVEQMVKAAKAFIESGELAGIFAAGEAETTLVWDKNGMLCKARPDWLATDRKVSLSYKTTAGSAQPDAWIRTQLPGYDMGIVFYEQGIRSACKVERTRVVTLVQEQKPPFSCSLIGLAPAWQALAESKLARAMMIWSRCLIDGKFPAYTPQICYAEPKDWMLSEMEDRELQEISEHGIEYSPEQLWGKP